MYRRKADQLLTDYRLSVRQVQTEQSQLQESQKRLQATEQAQGILQTIAANLQQKAHKEIAKIVTRCLNAIFDDPYEFEIVFEKKRGKTEASLIFHRGNMTLDDPLNEVGGGVIDVAAFALRLAAIVLSRPAKRKLLILDEPFKNIRGEANRQRAREMVKRVSEDLGVQIIINTDIPTFQLGKIVEMN
jgi:hypothetical protein